MNQQLVSALNYTIPKEVEKKTFTLSDPNPELQTSKLVNSETTIVGFATIVDKNEMIKSLQPIYYTRN